jgi:hypothetical protein
MGNQATRLKVLGRGIANNEIDKDEEFIQLEAETTMTSEKPNDFYFYIHEKINGLQSSYCDRQQFPPFQNRMIVRLETKALFPGRRYYVKWFHGNQSHGDLMCVSDEFMVFSSSAVSKRQFDEDKKLQRENQIKKLQSLEFQLEENKKAKFERERREVLIMEEKRRVDDNLNILNAKKRKLEHASEMSKEMYKINVNDRKVFKKYFDKIDVNLNGEIDFDEMFLYFRNVGDYTMAEVKMLMDQADLNSDNVIRLDEFITIAKLSTQNPRANKSPAWDRLVGEVARSYSELSPRTRISLSK